jgi:hypothetical protein
MSKETKVKKQEELPEMKGKGVEVLSIPEIESAAESYREIRDKRMELTEKECKAKEVLLITMQRHKDKLPKDSTNGTSFYRFDDRIVELQPGSENVKVKSVHAENED